MRQYLFLVCVSGSKVSPTPLSTPPPAPGKQASVCSRWPVPVRMDCHWRIVKATTSFQLIACASCTEAIRVLLANTEMNDCLIGGLIGSRGYADWVSIKSLLLSSLKVDERPCYKDALQSLQSVTSKMPLTTVKSGKAMVR